MVTSYPAVTEHIFLLLKGLGTARQALFNIGNITEVDISGLHSLLRGYLTFASTYYEIVNVEQLHVYMYHRSIT